MRQTSSVRFASLNSAFRSNRWWTALLILGLGLTFGEGCSKAPEVAQVPPPPPAPSEDSFARFIATNVANASMNLPIPVPDPETDSAAPAEGDQPAADTTASEKPESVGAFGDDPNAVAKPKAQRKRDANGMVAIDIPRASSADDAAPFEIAKVAAPMGSLCSIRLIGGDFAVPGPGQFTLSPDSNDPNSRKWNIMLEDVSNDPPMAKVAELAIRNNVLWMRWSTDVLFRDRAEYVRNCILQVTVDSQVQTLALRKPIQADTVVAKFMDAVTVNWNIPFAPDAKNVRVEFDFPESVFTTTNYAPRDVLTASKDLSWAVFGASKPQQGFKLKLDTEMKEKEKLSIKLTPHFQIETDIHNVRISQTSLSNAELHAPAAVLTIEKRLAEVQSQGAQQARPPTNSRSRTRGPVVNHAKLHAEQARRARRDLEEAQIAIQQIDAMKVIRANVERDGTIQIRAYLESEGLQLDLMATSL